jgi:Protein of unknown function/AsmA-like C-terminal region
LVARRRELRRQIVRIGLISGAALLISLLVVGAAFFWRLSNGPVALDFMRERIETKINQSLPGMSVRLGGAVFELDAETRVPHFRLRDVVMMDASGNLIARSQRAAIGFEGRPMFMGRLVPNSLELIGTRVLVKRTIDGSIVLGFGEQAAAPDETADFTADSSQSSEGKGDKNASQPAFTMAKTRPLIDVLTGDTRDAAASSVSEIRVTEASIQFFDEINQANWIAPKADLNFKRMPYGFVVFAKASVASGPTEWQTEITANYRKQEKIYSVTGRVDNLIPANVADKIFALAQFARINVPLFGQIEFEATDAGTVTKATAEFNATAGVVGLPEYFAEPLVVDEGSLRVDYDAASGGFNIVDSVLLVGASRAQLTGRIDPLRAADGRLTDVQFKVNANNVSVDTQGTVTNPVLVDRVEFSGKSSVEAARLDIDDLLVMSGQAGVRLRGTITGGAQSAGILLSGRVRDISAPFLKQLWPPIVGPKSRVWVTENVESGRIVDGAFNVNIPVDGLAAAKRDKLLPDDTVEFTFTMADVQSRYFKSLPALTDASGTAHLRGNTFDLRIDGGQVTLPSGAKVSAGGTSFHAENLLADPVPGKIQVNLAASAAAMMELGNHPDLHLFDKLSTKMPQIDGAATAQIDLSFPLIKNVPRDMVKTAATIRIVDASAKGFASNLDLSNGDITITSDRTATNLAGNVRINGFPAKIAWSRATPDAVPQANVTATFDDKAREKLGIKLGTFMRGPVKLTAAMTGIGTQNQKMDIEADLSETEMQLDAIRWRRPAVGNTKATFTYIANGGARSIRDLRIKGPGIGLAGNVELGANNTLKVAELSQVWLNDENNFAMTIRPSDTGQSISISGASFDARPFVKSLFSGQPSSASAANAKTNLNIQARLDRVIAHRGEIATNVSADMIVRGGFVQQAEVKGQFLSGNPLTIRVRPGEAGRQMEVNSGDGGATLRASNLYSKVSGGQLTFTATLSGTRIQGGRLVLRDFAVRNENALAAVDNKGKARKSGPRRDGLKFTKLTLPFSSDEKFIRVCDTLLRGNDLGAKAQGVIRKSDGAIDITGTIIPAYGINSALSNIPLVREILTGGKGQGVFGITFALGGSFAQPKFQVNPVSALAPGFLRNFFEYDGPCRGPLKQPRANR